MYGMGLPGLMSAKRNGEAAAPLRAGLCVTSVSPRHIRDGGCRGADDHPVAPRAGGGGGTGTERIPSAGPVPGPRGAGADRV